jgi:type III secretion protein D
MKQLRILTGEHAGVSLELTSTRYVIGADDKADIQLLDWQSSPVVIEVTEEQVVNIAVNPGDLFVLQPEEVERFDDFSPRRVGDIVLCVGPAQGAWPSDLDLITRLTQPAANDTDAAAAAAGAAAAGTEPAAPALPMRSRRRMGRVLSVVAGLAMLTGFGATVARMNNGSGTQNAQRGAPALPLKARVERTVAELSLPGLDVVQTGEQVAVRGLVRSTADAAALRARLEGLKVGGIVHAYASAADVAQDIAEGLGLPGLEVSWRGNGVFAVSGRTVDLDRLNAAAARLRTDLAPLVQRIDVVATEKAPNASAPISAALNAGELKYVQTRDGVKHLSLSGPPVIAADEPPHEVKR